MGLVTKQLYWQKKIVTSKITCTKGRCLLTTTVQWPTLILKKCWFCHIFFAWNTQTQMDLSATKVLQKMVVWMNCCVSLPDFSTAMWMIILEYSPAHSYRQSHVWSCWSVWSRDPIRSYFYALMVGFIRLQTIPSDTNPLEPLGSILVRVS